MQEALQDSGKHTKLTQLSDSHLTPKQRAYIRRTGKLPKKFPFHHFMAVADFPEFAHLAEVGAGLPENVHTQAAHGGDTTRPLEAATFIAPGAEDAVPFNVDPRSKKGGRAPGKRSQILEGDATSSKGRGGVDRDARIVAEERLRQLQAQQQENPARYRERQIREVEDFLRDTAPAPKPAAGGKPPAPAPAAAATTTPSDATQPAAAPQPGPVHEPLPAPQPGPAPGSGEHDTAAQPKVRIGTDDIPPDQPKAEVKTEGDAEQTKIRIATGEPEPEPLVDPRDAEAEREMKSENEAAEEEKANQRAARQLTVPRQPPGSKDPSKKDEPEGQFSKNMREFKGVYTGPLTLAESAMLATAGPAGVVAMRSAVKARSEPIIRHVNPNYAPPPCMPQDIVNIQNDILQALEAKAQAEGVAAAMTAQEKHHKANEKPRRHGYEDRRADYGD